MDWFAGDDFGLLWNRLPRCRGGGVQWFGFREGDGLRGDSRGCRVTACWKRLRCRGSRSGGRRVGIGAGGRGFRSWGRGLWGLG